MRPESWLRPSATCSAAGFPAGKSHKIQSSYTLEYSKSPSLKLKIALEINGWEMRFFFLETAYFQGRLLLVSERN